MHEEIAGEQTAKLHELKLVVGRHPQLSITNSLAAEMGQEVVYARSKGLNEEACKSLIVQMRSETGPAPRVTIAALPDDLLPAILTDQQKSKKVSNLLSK